MNFISVLKELREHTFFFIKIQYLDIYIKIRLIYYIKNIIL